MKNFDNEVMKVLIGKKVLLLAPRFFNYENSILNEIRKLGGQADYYDERPGNDFFTKLCIRLGYKKILANKINQYYSHILEKVNDVYDFVLIVNTESITKDILIKFREKLSKSKFIIYMWDSVKNKKGQIEFVNLVDKFITFDQNDIEFDNKIKYHPLFYVPEYESISRSVAKYKYDLLFIGTVHSDRYSIIKKIKDQLLANRVMYCYFYHPSKIVFILKKIFDKNFRRIPMREVSFVPLRREQVISLIAQSRVILDVEHPSQSGLTMRTIESFGAKRKMITSNNNIKKYNFYNELNQKVFDRDTSEIVVDDFFFDSPFESRSESVYTSYSLRNWLAEIFAF